MNVLLDQKHRDTAFIDASNDVEVLLDQPGRKPEGRLIDKQQLGRAHQAAPDRYHRLLASRHRSGELRSAFREPRKTLQNLRKTRPDRFFRPLMVSANTQIFFDGQLGKYLAPLRN